MNKIILKESELAQLIEKQIRTIISENEIEEGVWDNVKSGFKGAFGNDAKNIASKTQNMYNQAKQGVKNMGQNVSNAYDSVKKGVNDRVNAFKANYTAEQNASKINSVIETLKDLQNNGVISGKKTNATIVELERLLQMGVKGMRGRATQTSNRIGR